MSNKLLKSELKEIVKECLVEILSEGISTKAVREPVRESHQAPVSRRASFDHVSWAKDNNLQESRAPDPKVAASALTRGWSVNEKG